MTTTDDRITWVDYGGQGPASTGKPSRTHRLDGSRPVTDPPSARFTTCGMTVPRLGGDRFATIFETVEAEGTGLCLRCFPYTCRMCRRRKATGECCTAHGQRLCHACYRLAHFVQVCTITCPDCAAEGLPVFYPPIGPKPTVTLPDISTVGSP